MPDIQDRVIELRALGEAAVSISCCDLSVHASGGLQRLSWSHEVGAWPLLVRFILCMCVPTCFLHCCCICDLGWHCRELNAAYGTACRML